MAATITPAFAITSVVVKIQLAFMCAPPFRCRDSSHIDVAFAASAAEATMIMSCGSGSLPKNPSDDFAATHR